MRRYRKTAFLLSGIVLFAGAIGLLYQYLNRGSSDAKWLAGQSGVSTNEQLYEGMAGTFRRLLSLSKGFVSEVTIVDRELNGDLAKAVSSISTCKGLSLIETSQTDVFLGNLTRSTTLEHVELIGTDVSALGLERLARLNHLTELRVEFYELTSGECLVPLERNKTIEWLAITGVVLDSNSLAAVARLNKLRRLTLTYSNLDDVERFPLPCEALEMLEVTGDSIGPSQSKWIVDHPRLNSLILMRCQLLQTDWSTIANNKSLLAVYLNGGEYDVQQLRSLAQSPQLSSLAIIESGQLLDARFLKSLSSFKSLNNLALDSNHIEAGAIVHLADCHTLRELSLNNCGITAEEVSELFALKSLLTLNLNDNPLSSTQIEELRRALPRCQIVFTEQPPPVSAIH